MAGHSKWANIKHRKARTDKKRAKMWSKIAHQIIVAARLGGGDPNTNSRLALAVSDARKENMPKDNIDRAIKRGTGELEGEDPEELVYEGYGPGGVAVIVEALTDNRNRTAGEVKFAFDKSGGNLGQSGCVMHSFDRKGVVVLKRDAAEEDALFELALEAGAEDVTSDDEFFTITTPATELEPVKQALNDKGIDYVSAELAYLPQMTIEVDEDTARKVQNMLDRFDDLLDVQEVYTNHEPPESMLEELAG